MISLNDQPLTTHQLPHSSVLCADWISTTLSTHNSMNRTQAKCLHTCKKGNKPAGHITKIFCTKMKFIFGKKKELNFSLLYLRTVTSGHGVPRFGPWSRFLNAVWTLSPYFRGPPLVVPPSSHTPGQAGELFELILLLPLTEVLPSELELVPGRGTVIAHSS